MAERSDSPDALQWSGVHRGPLRAGEWVRLVDGKGRRHNFCLEPGKRFFSNKGHLEHDELIGREEGFTVTSSAAGQYLVFRPLLHEFVVSMPRGAAVVYPKDAAPRGIEITNSESSGRKTRYSPPADEVTVKPSSRPISSSWSR